MGNSGYYYILVGGFKHDLVHFIYGMSSFPLTNSSGLGETSIFNRLDGDFSMGHREHASASPSRAMGQDGAKFGILRKDVSKMMSC